MGHQRSCTKIVSLPPSLSSTIYFGDLRCVARPRHHEWPNSFSMFSFLFEKYFHVHLCTWAFCTLCTQNALTYVGMWLCVWNVNRWQKHSVAWYGIARHGMSWYWIAIFFARPLLYVSLNSLNKTTLMIMGAREHTFSLLWQALFPTFLSILFFFLFGQLLYYMGLIQYRKRICMFFTEQHTHNIIE